MKRLLITGSKEYPLGANNSFDPSPSGGMEVYSMYLAEALSKDYEVMIITRRFPETKKYDKKQNIQTIRVPFIRGRLIRNASFNLTSFFKSLFLDYDILISQDLISSFFGVFTSRIKRKPQIAVCHGLVSVQPQFSWVFRQFLKIIEKIAFNFSTLTITHCPEWQIRKVTKNYKIIKPGLNIIEKTNEKKREYKGKVILFVGRLLKVKGVEFLINSLKDLDFEYTCVIVGDGPERKSLEELAKKSKANVVFEGQQKNILSFLDSADVFVLPSISESLGYSMLEAMSRGVPCVVSDIGIASEKEAFIVKPKDSKEIGAAITKTVRDKNLSRKKTINAMKFLEQFEWSTTAKEYSKIINSLIKR